MPGLLSMLAMVGALMISTFSTGAQSRPLQHSIGYQSCAATGVAAASRAAKSHFLDIGIPSSRSPSGFFHLPLIAYPPQSYAIDLPDGANGVPLLVPLAAAPM